MYAVIFCLGVFRMTGEKERYPLLRDRTDRIDALIRSLPPDAQRITEKLIETYIESID